MIGITNNFLAYIGPGSGLPFSGLLAGLLLVGSGLIGIIFLKLKQILKYFGKRPYLTAIILLAILVTTLILIAQNKTSTPTTSKKKVVVIGIDALDYQLISKLIKEDKLSHFKQLSNKGSFKKLNTTTPAESSVAWASFATGLNPGNHAIFDFIMHDASYRPYLSLFKTYPGLGGPRFKSRLKAKTLWQISSRANVATYFYFAPLSFPPDKVKGELISGMGVPDLRGTLGTFAFYTTAKTNNLPEENNALVFNLKNKSYIQTWLAGPKNSLQPQKPLRLPMTLRVNSEQNQLRIEVSDKRLTLKPGQWSDWLKVSFRVTPVDKVKGVCRFYLKSLTPLQLYCSPLNFDPRSPLAAISYPQDLTAQLAKRIGLFYTQGMPYETSALNQGFINKDAFLTQARSILGKRQQILKLKLAEFNHGLFFFYFEYPDTIQHFFWQDKDNPDSNYQEIVTDCYQKMDKIIGWVMDNIDKNTTLLVLSDHGFSSFKYSAHLNTWLKNKGWLKLKQNQDTGNFSDIDWTKTKAYALGFGGIYLNIKGIRKQGAVNPGAEAKKLRQKIKQALVNWQNPQTKGTVISQVYNKEEVFKGKYSEQAPDLFIGFNHGYRASWQTALGKVTPQQLTANTRPWNGSHIIDPKLVPGVLFSNQKLSNEKKAKITDLAPTILDILKVEINQDFDGESLL